jgi:hypothetical protein
VILAAAILSWAAGEAAAILSWRRVILAVQQAWAAGDSGGAAGVGGG